MAAILWGSVPWTMVLAGLAICLLVSALGFRRVDWFISLGYGFSVAAEALAFAWVYRDVIDAALVAQVLLVATYGLRLGGFLALRERSPSFARELTASRERSASVTGMLKFVIWVSVALLYAAMVSPALFSLAARAGGLALPSLWPGVIVMALGLVLEAAADWQKSAFKAREPDRFVSRGLFAIVRSPNYFGEMLFWFGLFVSGLSAYASLVEWVIAAVGLVCIELVMLGSARRLELKQAERYGADPAYRHYARQVPILVPGLPLYSLKNLPIYLG